MSITIALAGSLVWSIDADKVIKNIAINQMTFGIYQEIIPNTWSLCDFALLFSLDVISVTTVHKTLNILTHAIKLLWILVTIDHRAIVSGKNTTIDQN
jgi:hypothetical protein